MRTAANGEGTVEQQLHAMPSGAGLTARAIRSTAKPALADLLDRLGPRSRRLRFRGPKSHHASWRTSRAQDELHRHEGRGAACRGRNASTNAIAATRPEPESAIASSDSQTQL
jgi:hypothetical protein